LKDARCAANKCIKNYSALQCRACDPLDMHRCYLCNRMKKHRTFLIPGI